MIIGIVFFAAGPAAGEPIDRCQWVHPRFFAESGVVPVHLSDAFARHFLASLDRARHA